MPTPPPKKKPLDKIDAHLARLIRLGMVEKIIISGREFYRAVHRPQKAST
jgi:hypothetical protein